jgi:ribosome-binding protein aMBF1 (putative translation factor)
MSVFLPKPKSITSDEVVLSRVDWERLVSALEHSDIDEDVDDIAAVTAARAENAELAARLEAKRGSPVETTIPIEVVKAVLDGVHPIESWRKYRGWTQSDLCLKSGVESQFIERLEARREEAGTACLSRIARALGVPMDALIDDDENAEIPKGEPR